MAEGAGSGERFLPARYQQPLPPDRLILQDRAPGAGARMETEVARVGGGPARSGAVVNPRPFRELFPDLNDADFPFRGPVTSEAVHLLTAHHAPRIPTPPTMHNAGNYIASLCEIVRWLGEKAEALGVTLFTGFPAASL